MNNSFRKVYAISLATICLSSAHAALINGFGSSEWSASDGSVFAAQSATDTTFSGLDNGSVSFIGAFAASADISANPNALVLSATQSTGNTSGFTVTLYSTSDYTNFFQQSYTGNWGSFATGSKTDVILPVSLINSSFVNNNVVGMDISFGGTGGTLTVVFDALSTSAIPEPSTYAALFGLGALCLSAVRRRRKVA